MSVGDTSYKDRSEISRLLLFGHSLFSGKNGDHFLEKVPMVTHKIYRGGNKVYRDSEKLGPQSTVQQHYGTPKQCVSYKDECKATLWNLYQKY